MPEVKDQTKTKKNHQGKLLRILRTNLGKTQEQVAKDNDMVQSQIYELELKDSLPNETLVKFANYYGVSVEFLTSFNLDEFAKNYTYNNNATVNDNGTDINNQDIESENITINSSVKEVAKVLNEGFDREKALLNEIFELRLENALLKQKYEQTKE